MERYITLMTVPLETYIGPIEIKSFSLWYYIMIWFPRLRVIALESRRQ